MEPELESWYVLEDVLFGQNEWRIRLIPDHFSSEIVKPVFEVWIKSPTDEAQARVAIARFRTECIVDVQLTATAAELWGEYDDTPVVVAGTSVSFTRSSYNSNDLLRIIQRLEEQLSQWQSENVRLRTQVHEIKGYAADLLRRAEVKKSLTSRSTATEDAQIDVLQRMLNKISAA
jgi:hypothetical protein